MSFSSVNPAECWVFFAPIQKAMYIGFRRLPGAKASPVLRD
jgi:hypothetical protein